MKYWITILIDTLPTLVAESVNNETNVILIPPQHPEILTKYIIDILQHKYDHIGLNALKTIEQYFSWDVICNQTVKLYERALSEKHT